MNQANSTASEAMTEANLYLLKFWSTTCGICGRMSAYDSKVAEAKGIEFVSVQRKDTKTWDRLTYVAKQKYEDPSQMGYPTYLLCQGAGLDDLKVLGEVLGGSDKGEFRRKIEAILENPDQQPVNQVAALVPIQPRAGGVRITMSKDTGDCEADDTIRIRLTMTVEGDRWNGPTRYRVKRNNNVVDLQDYNCTYHDKELSDGWHRFNNSEISWKAKEGAWEVTGLPTEPDTTNNSGVPASCRQQDDLSGPKKNTSKQKSLAFINYKSDGSVRDIPCADIGEVRDSCKFSDSGDAYYVQFWSGKNNLSQEQLPNGKLEFVLLDKDVRSTNVVCKPDSCSETFVMEMDCPSGKCKEGEDVTLKVNANGVANRNVYFTWYKGSQSGNDIVSRGDDLTKIDVPCPQAGKDQKYSVWGEMKGGECTGSTGTNCTIEAQDAVTPTPSPTPTDPVNCDFDVSINCPDEAPPSSTVTLKAQLSGIAEKDCRFQWYEGTTSGKELGTNRSQTCTYPFSGKQRFTCKVTSKKSPCNNSESANCILEAAVEDCSFKLDLDCPPDEGTPGSSTVLEAIIDDVDTDDCRIQWWKGSVDNGTKLGTGITQTATYPVFGSEKYFVVVSYVKSPCFNTKQKNCTLKSGAESCDFTPRITCPGKAYGGSNVNLSVELTGAEASDCKFQWYEGSVSTGKKLGTNQTQQCQYPILGVEKQKYTCEVTYQKIPCNNTKTTSCSLESFIESCDFKPSINCPGPRKAGTEVNLTVDIDDIDSTWTTYQWWQGNVSTGTKLGTGAKQKVTYPAAGEQQKYSVEVTNNDPPCKQTESNSCTITSSDPDPTPTPTGSSTPEPTDPPKDCGEEFEISFNCPPSSAPAGSQVKLVMSANKDPKWHQPQWYIDSLDSPDRVGSGYEYTYTYPPEGVTQRFWAYCNYNEPGCMDQDFTRCDLTGTAPNPTPSPTPTSSTTPSPTPTSSSTPTPSPTPTGSSTPTPSPTPSTSPTPTPSPSPTDPCTGVTCLPPKECVDGKCVCPDGTIDVGGLCLSDDRCLNVLCPPNSTCVEGVCICDAGYVLNGKGYCVMAETPDCTEDTDCCPSNATIQIKAGSGLGGGGSFRLNQPCDKTIMLWVDDLSETADEECNENGQAQICSCTAEMAVLMDMIVELKAELDTLKDEFAAQEDD